MSVILPVLCNATSCFTENLGRVYDNPGSASFDYTSDFLARHLKLERIKSGVEERDKSLRDRRGSGDNRHGIGKLSTQNPVTEPLAVTDLPHITHL